MGDEVHAAPVEADERAAGCSRRHAAGETREPLRGFFDIGDRDDQIDET